jgi:hypothetical protein
LIGRVVAVKCTLFSCIAVRKKFGLSDGSIKFVFERDGSEIEDVVIDVLQLIAEQQQIIQVLAAGQEWTASESVVGVIRHSKYN